MKTDDDDLLRALRALPRPTATAHEAQARNAARAAFLEAARDEPFAARFARRAGRTLVPVVLASVVGLYLFWAFTAAAALVH